MLNYLIVIFHKIKLAMKIQREPLEPIRIIYSNIIKQLCNKEFDINLRARPKARSNHQL